MYWDQLYSSKNTTQVAMFSKLFLPVISYGWILRKFCCKLSPLLQSDLRQTNWCCDNADVAISVGTSFFWCLFHCHCHSTDNHRHRQQSVVADGCTIVHCTIVLQLGGVIIVVIIEDRLYCADESKPALPKIFWIYMKVLLGWKQKKRARNWFASWILPMTMVPFFHCIHK